MLSRLDRARPVVVHGLLIILMAVVFVPMIFFRLADDDEGTYLLVSRLVSRGQMPFHDFFYPQMFLLPYVYGAWMKLVGCSWYGARLLSVIFSVVLGLLLFRQVVGLAGARVWGVLAAVLFTFTSLVFGWYPLVKTLVLPTLLLFVAYAVVSTTSRWRWAASGFLIGLAVDCRIYVIAAVPAFMLELYLEAREDPKSRLMKVAQFGIGLLLALLPNELFFLIEPDTFLFNIVGNQLIRSDFGFREGMEQKINTVGLLLGINGADGAISIQFLVLFLLNLAAWISDARSRSRPPLASTIAVSLMLVSLVPTPAYTQYFCIPLPFLVVTAVVFLAKLADENRSARFRHVLASLTVLYLLVSPFDLYRYTLASYFDPGSNLRLTTIRAVSRAIDRQVLPERPFVISLWPAYLVETKASILPGLENQFALMFSHKVTPREVEQYKLMSYPALIWHVQRHSVDVIVVVGGAAAYGTTTEGMRQLSIQNGYVLNERIAGVEVYTLPPAARR